MVEMMAVMVLMVLLSTVLTYAVRSSIEHSKRIACASNLRQLFMANAMYATEHDLYVAAASDLYGKNLKRWHGSRKSARQPFDGSTGPLAPYLNHSRVRACPCQGRLATGASLNAFETSCGGYGYNAIGVGSQTYLLGMSFEANVEGMSPDDIYDPARTVMFCDTAFPQPYGKTPAYLIEYSFAEPYHWVIEPGKESSYRADPSIHFRHQGRANVVWCDGHITAERLQTRAQDHFTKFRIGWFGPEDNSLFDNN